MAFVDVIRADAGPGAVVRGGRLRAVYVDFSKNGSKRYCDTGNCGNRMNVNAYVAGRREKAPDGRRRLLRGLVVDEVADGGISTSSASGKIRCSRRSASIGVMSSFSAAISSVGCAIAGAKRRTSFETEATNPSYSTSRSWKRRSRCRAGRG
jgi:hypothetical protein